MISNQLDKNKVAAHKNLLIILDTTMDISFCFLKNLISYFMMFSGSYLLTHSFKIIIWSNQLGINFFKDIILTNKKDNVKKVIQNLRIAISIDHDMQSIVGSF